MTKKNPFTKRKNYLWGFIHSSIFVTLLIAAYITNTINNNVTNNIIDKIKNGCYTTFKDKPVNLQACLKKSEEARSFKDFNMEICGGCNENQLCLKGEDLQYCESQLNKNKGWINLRDNLKNITNPILKLSLFNNILIIMGLFVVGFTGRELWSRFK